MKKPTRTDSPETPPTQECVTAHRTEEGEILDSEGAHAAHAAEISEKPAESPLPIYEIRIEEGVTDHG